jgi:hypothetical protein
VEKLNAGARWAFDRFASVDPTQPCWDGPAVVTAMRRHLIALSMSEPDWVVMAGSPGEERELVRRHRWCTDRYLDASRLRVKAELDWVDSVTKRRFDAGVDQVFSHFLTETLVEVRGGWDQVISRGNGKPAFLEVAVAVGARGALLSGDFIWAWDQAQVAFEAGLGWFTLVEDGLIVLPRPKLVTPRGRLHRTDGPAVTWSDGTEQYYFEGVEFERKTHRRLVQRNMTAAEALALPDPRQELLAMTAAPSDDVLALLKAVHLDTGAKGTRLYRVDGHFERSRTDYCVTMTDPSTGRSYLEWVDPEIGQQHDAELCQAHMVGIELDDWLSLTLEA